jgi:tetratricopeptide (TPR) repeat protein
MSFVNIHSTFTITSLTRLKGRSATRLVNGLLTLSLMTFIPGLAAQDAQSVEEKDPVQTYYDAIEQAHTLGGPYATELVDLYYGYGQALLDEGDYEGARDAFHRTVMVSRVNDGPNNLEQCNYLYSVAEAEARLGDLEASMEVLEHIYRLNATAYGEDDPAMLPVLEQIVDWYTEKKPIQGPLLGASDIENRSYLADRVAALTLATEGLGSSKTALGYRALGQFHFKSILYLLRSGESPHPELIMNNEETNDEFVYQRALRKHFKGGEEAFTLAVDSWRANPDATDLEVAEAMAQLGDWFLALEHFRAAAKQYEQAYQLLVGSEEFANMAEAYFGRPAPLQFLNTSGSFVRDLNPPIPPGGMEISMTVTRNGRLIDIEFVSPPDEQSDDSEEKIREQLQSTRFRPAVVAGEVETTHDFVWKPPLVGHKLAARDG